MKKSPGDLPQGHVDFLMRIWITGHDPKCMIDSQPIKWGENGILSGIGMRYDDPIVNDLRDWGYVDVNESARFVIITREATECEKELMKAHMNFTRRVPCD